MVRKRRNVQCVVVERQGQEYAAISRKARSSGEAGGREIVVK